MHSSSCSHHHADRKIRQTPVLLAFVLILAFAMMEFLVGRFSHSLVLVADAGHMISDGLALGIALLAIWAARLSPPRSHPADKPSWETWAALINGVGLTAISLWIGWEALTRLQTPPTEIASFPMLITAGIGAGVNGINVALLHRDSHHDLNLRAAFLHVLADTLSCVGVIVAAIVVTTLHWLWIDGAISLFVAGLILSSTFPLVVQATKTLTTHPSPTQSSGAE